MAEFNQKKINIKIFDPPLTGTQLTKYTEFKGVHVSDASDFSLLGEVVIDGGLFGTLVFKKEIWNDNIRKGPNYDLFDRIVIKFLQRTGTTIGSIEERLLKEFALYPLSEKQPLFTIFLKSSPFIIDFEIESDKLIFSLPNKAGKGIFDVFQIDKKVGNNFGIKKKFLDRKIASVESKRGDKIELKITDENSANDDDFIASIVLFAGTTKYYDEIAMKIRHGAKALTEGTFVLCPPETELKSMILSSEAQPTRKGKEKLRPHKREVEIPKKEKKPEVAIQEKIEALQKSAKKPKKAVEEGPTKKVSEAAPVKKVVEKAAKAKPAKKMVEAVPVKKEVEKPLKKAIIEEPAELAEIEASIAEAMAAEPPEKPLFEEPTAKLELEESMKPAKLKEPPKKEILKPLSLEDSIIKIEGVTEKIRILLENIGIEIVDDLLFVDPGVLAERVGHKDVTALKIKEWQMAAEKRIKATQKPKET